jgi:para-nitrobenzyl esterase
MGAEAGGKRTSPGIGRRRIICGLAMAAVLATGQAPAADAPAADKSVANKNVVNVDTGAIQGAPDGDAVAFKNIPYAAPPVGDRRWRSPAPAEAWTGVRDATRYGNDCLQNRLPFDTTASSQPMSEDCLYLNVWMPGAAAAPKLPVLVWIHGGGFVSGSGTAEVMDGGKLTKQGVVLVTFNYRLGRFGFFAHPALSAESPDAAVGNYAFMDQIAALQWVKRNIAAFGGDPGNVTVFGQSAGAESINYLMLAPQAKGLFQKAIVMSGGGRTPWPKLRENTADAKAAETVGLAFAKAAKAGEGVAGLRALSATKVLGGISMLDHEPDTFSGPMIDGRLVGEGVAAGFAAGHQARIPYLIGTTSNELGFLPSMFMKPVTTPLIDKLGNDASDVQAAYGSEDAYEARLANDFIFVEPARFLATSAAAAQPVFLYRFSYVSDAKRKDQDGGVHASDIPYVFGNLEATGDKVSDGDRRMSQFMQDYFLSFARGGVPKAAGQKDWPAYTAKGGKLLDFTVQGAAVAGADSPALDALTRHFAKAAAPAVAAAGKSGN